MTKDELLSLIWPQTYVSDAVLKVCVREIRQALGDEPAAPRFVQTAARLGYRFIGHLAHTSLPAARSSLVGRQREIEDITHALGQARLVTLVGAGGSGKSRLALEVAGSIEDLFDDGACWIDLAPLGDASFLVQSIAGALGVRDQPGQQLAAQLAGFLAAKATLLVVDNCEHVIEPTADLIGPLLRAAPRLRVLATSREPLRSDGERVILVPPLSLPEAQTVPTAEEAIAYDAIRLFAERAQDAVSSFALSGSNCQAVVETCRRLDGMPLAIELAAARVRVMPVAQIAARLHDSFSVLAPGRRGELGRHQTLHAAIDWSYELLAADERQALRRIAVFVDSFTMEAAERVASGPGTPGTVVFDVLGRLVDKSLLFVSDQEEAGGWRYRLLETVRQYALEKLQADEDASGAWRGHLEYYLELAETKEPQINTADRQGVLALLDRERANVRTAIERAIGSNQPEPALRLASAMFWYWFHRGYWHEGRALLGAAIRRAIAPTRCRARALLGDGVLAWAQGDQAAAGPRLEESAAIGRSIADPATTAHALHFLAMVRLAEGDAAGGRRLAQEAVRIAGGADDPFCLTTALASSGVLLLALGEYDEARSVLEQSVERGRQSGDKWAVALPLRNLAIIDARQGQYAAARSRLEDSLRELADLGEKWFLSRSLETLAEVLAWEGLHERAAPLFGAAQALRDAVGASVLPFYRADYDGAIAMVRESLGPETFDRLWQRGRALTPDEAVRCARVDTPSS